MGVRVVGVPRVCPLCGGVVDIRVGPVEWDVRGELVIVDGVEHGMCVSCGEAFFDQGTADLVHRRAVAQLKRSKGLLSGEEVKALRQKLGVTQAGLERLIGAGPKTVVRWENDTVFQNHTADTLLRVLDEYPEVAADLMARATRRETK